MVLGSALTVGVVVMDDHRIEAVVSIAIAERGVLTVESSSEEARSVRAHSLHEARVGVITAAETTSGGERSANAHSHPQARDGLITDAMGVRTETLIAATIVAHEDPAVLNATRISVANVTSIRTHGMCIALRDRTSSIEGIPRSAVDAPVSSVAPVREDRVAKTPVSGWSASPALRPALVPALVPGSI